MNLWPLGTVFPVCPHEHHEKANRHRGVGMKQMEEKQRPKIENDHGILVWVQLFKRPTCIPALGSGKHMNFLVTKSPLSLGQVKLGFFGLIIATHSDQTEPSYNLHACMKSENFM